MPTERCNRITRVCMMALAAHLGMTIGVGATDLGLRGITHRHAGIPSACRTVWKCGRFGCAWHRICPRTCPGHIGCSSLYGAYGPDGGTAFWSAFTGTAFSAYR